MVYVRILAQLVHLVTMAFAIHALLLAPHAQAKTYAFLVLPIWDISLITVA